MYCKQCGEPMNDNQAVCLKCGVEAGTGNAFCPNCGQAVIPDAVICVNCGVSLKTNNESKKNAPNVDGIKERSIVTAILLSIITCGIYSIFWWYAVSDRVGGAAARKLISEHTLS